MLRRYGGDKAYRTTYQSGIQWQVDRRNAGFFRRIASKVRSLLAAVAKGFVTALYFVMYFFSGVAGAISGKNRPAPRHKDTMPLQDAEPISVRSVRLRHSSRHSFFTPDGAVLRRVFLMAMAIILLVSSAIAVPPVVTLASINTVMLLDEDAGIATEIMTKAATVGELLDLYHIKLSVGDIVYPDRTQPLKDGQEIRVRRAMSVSMAADGVERDLRIQAGTVREALAMAGMTYDADDIILPSLNTKLQPGMAITVTRVSYEYVTETQRLYYQKIIQKDKTLYVGEEVVAQQGKEGEKALDIRLEYRDGVEYASEVIGERVLSAPEHLIIKQGTKEKPAVPKATPKPAAVSASANTVSSSTSSSSEYKTNKYWVFYKDKQYEKKSSLTVTATAYTHTGNRTATNTWPSVGTIAVDKSVIPLGTRLYVPGYGIGIAADTGSAIKGNKIDVFFDTYEECQRYGRKTVTIYIIGKPQPREI